MIDEISYFFSTLQVRYKTLNVVFYSSCVFTYSALFGLVFLYIGFAVNIDLLKLLDFLLSNKVGGDQAFAFDESSTSKLTGDSVVF